MKQSALLCAVLLFDTNVAFACFCSRQSNVQQARDEADAVFLGRVKSVEFPNGGGSGVLVRFDVERVWKGNVSREFEMRSVIESADCEGFNANDLVIGKQLIVFANRRFSDLKFIYTTNICTLTGPPGRYGDTIKELDRVRPKLRL